MAQIDLGTASVTNGSNRVVSSAAADWTAYQTGTRVFWVKNENASYQVAAVTAPNLTQSGFWELTLAANYGGSTQVNVGYILTNSFSAQLELPLMAYGDAQGNVLFSRAMLKIEALILALQSSVGQLTANSIGNSANTHIDANGNLMIKNLTTGAWRYPIFLGQPGAETFDALDYYLDGTVNWKKDDAGSLMIRNRTTNAFRYIAFVGQPGAETLVPLDALQ